MPFDEAGQKVETTVFVNYYHCEGCGLNWHDEWSATCDDECPRCGVAYTPVRSEVDACHQCGHPQQKLIEDGAVVFCMACGYERERDSVH